MAANIDNLVKGVIGSFSTSRDKKVAKAIRDERSSIDSAFVSNDSLNDTLKQYATNDSITTKLSETSDTVYENIMSKIWSNTKQDSSGYFTTRLVNADNSYAQIFNESDGGGAMFYKKSKNIISFVGVNDGDGDGICVQIYSKYKDDVEDPNNPGTYSEIKNNGARLNVNPNGIYYTKGTNLTATGGTANSELAVKGDVKALRDKIVSLETLVSTLQTALANAVDANGNNVYTIPSP